MPPARAEKRRQLPTRSSSSPLHARQIARPGAEIISGIKVTVNGRELAVRLGERIRWHRERGDTLIRQMTKLAEIERNAVDDLVTILGRYKSPRGLMEKRLREHQDKATFLAFVRDHIAADAVFQLDSNDLRMIDVLPG
jgi:hypothetical protein